MVDGVEGVGAKLKESEVDVETGETAWHDARWQFAFGNSKSFSMCGMSLWYLSR